MNDIKNIHDELNNVNNAIELYNDLIIKLDSNETEAIYNEIIELELRRDILNDLIESEY